MPRYVALLRAVNVGGRTVQMADLRAHVTALAFRNVETFIASGNVLFDSPTTNTAALERWIERHLATSLGYEVETFVRSGAELTAVVSATPFAGSRQHEATNHLYVGFLKAPLPVGLAQRLTHLRTDTDEFRSVGREFYWSCRTSIGRSPRTVAALARTLTVVSTMRNMTTVRALARLTAG